MEARSLSASTTLMSGALDLGTCERCAAAAIEGYLATLI
jgi:hypothetical protein